MSASDLRALVVEDNELFRKRVLVPLVSGSGVAVEVATNVAEAFVRMDDEVFDMLFVDFHLPDGTGCDVMDRITVSAEGRPYMILVSGISDVREMKAALRSGARDFLIKPFELDEFREVLQRARDVLAASASPLPYWVEKFAAAHGSERAVRILKHRFEGCSIQEIAGMFELSKSGVKHWLRKDFFSPLGVHKLAELNAAARSWFEKMREG